MHSDAIATECSLTPLPLSSYCTVTQIPSTEFALTGLVLRGLGSWLEGRAGRAGAVPAARFASPSLLGSSEALLQPL